MQLYWWDSVIAGAKPGYKGQWSVNGGENVVLVAKCPDYCFSGGSIGASSIPPGVVGTPFSADVSTTGTTPGAVSATDLPPGLSIDGNGAITGTPTEAGEFHPIISTTADKTGPAPVLPDEKCTITKLLPITITEPDDEEE
jgi:hypothetical protein